MEKRKEKEGKERKTFSGEMDDYSKYEGAEYEEDVKKIRGDERLKLKKEENKDNWYAIGKPLRS